MMFICLLLIILIEQSHGNDLFSKIGDIKIKNGHATKAFLLPKGEVIYFWEQTRPPTEEEKRLRAEWFDKQWEEFRKNAEKRGIPKIEEDAREIAKELDRWHSKLPLIEKTVKPFLSAVARGMPMLMRQAMEIGHPLAREHFINQPVVVKSGLIIHYPNGDENNVQLDLEKFYGQESWARIPTEDINLRASPNGGFWVLETKDKFLLLFKIKDGNFIPIAKIQGQSPIGWSLNDRFMFVKSLDEGSFVVYEMQSLKEMAKVNLKSTSCNIKSSFIRAAAISDEFFVVSGRDTLCLYSLSDGSIRQPNIKMLRRIGGSPNSVIYGVAFSLDGRLLYIASARGFFVIDPYNFSLLDEYILPAGSSFYFQSLAGISPDGRYAAVLYGKERINGWATLFIWDIHNKRILQRIGTDEGKMLHTISAGFRHIYPPAILTKDWTYLLIILHDGTIELYRRR